MTDNFLFFDFISNSRYIEWWNDKEFKDVAQTADGLIKGGEWDYDKKFKDFNMELYKEDNEVKNNSSIAFVLSYHGYNLLFSADSCSSILSNGLNNVVKYMTKI